MTSLVPKSDARIRAEAPKSLRSLAGALTVIGRWRRRAGSAERVASTAITAAMVGYAAVVGLLCHMLGHAMNFRLDLYVGPFYLSYLLYGLTIYAILRLRMAKGRLHEPLLFFKGGWHPRDFLDRFLSALPFLLAFPLFMSGFTGMKTLLNEVVPFSWDADLSALGPTLHFGRHAWQWLDIESPLLTRPLEILYALWGVVLVAVPFAVSLRRPGCPIRTRFLVSYLLVLILLGNVAAGIFMSAGPFSFELTGARHDPYAGLFAYLNQADPNGSFSAIAFQRYLWDAHVQGITYIGTGISAFPSIHVAMAMLYVLFAWQFGRAARIASLLFLAGIMVGSVHLGWHYAVDGYAGCLGAAAIYFTVGWMQQRLRRSGGTPRREAAYSGAAA